MLTKQKEDYIFKIASRAITWHTGKELTKHDRERLANLVMLELVNIKQ